MKRYDAIVVGAGPAGSTTAYRLAKQGASVLLLDRATFPGGQALRRRAHRPSRRRASLLRRARGRARVRSPSSGSTTASAWSGGAGPARLHDAAQAPGRLPPGTGGRGRRRGTGWPPRHGGRVERRRTGCGRGRRADPRRDAHRGRRRERHHGEGAGLGGNRDVGVALEGNASYELVDPAGYRAGASSSSSTRFPAATPGSSRKAITRTSAPAAGAGPARICGSTSRGSVRCTGSGATTSPSSGASACRSVSQARRSPAAGRRSSVTRPGSSTPSPAMGSSKLLRAGGSPKPCSTSSAGGDARAVRAEAHPRARDALLRLVERESGARPLPAPLFAIAQTGLVWNVVEGIIRGEIKDVHGAGDLPSPA